MKQWTINRGLAAALLLALPVSCDSSTGIEDLYPVPVETMDGWQTASLESVGMDPEPLLRLLELISNTDDHLIHSILIVKDHRLVFEEYWPGLDFEDFSLNFVERSFNRDTPHYLASVTKSFTSALVGIAIDQGAIGGVEDSLFSYFPECSDERSEDNGPLTVEHLLNFSSGYDWNEHDYGFNDARDSHYQMFNAVDPWCHLLGRPVLFTPGSEFLYNSGDTNIAGEIVRRETSSPDLASFAEEYLFEPLGIQVYDWWRFPLRNEVNFASGGLYLRPRDMAKLGALYLNGGSWNGEQIVSSSWLDASTEMSIPFVGSYRSLYGYGYNWWLGRSQFGEEEVEYYRARGWGGQEIWVFADLDLILVFTAGGYWEGRPLGVNDLVEFYILESIIE
jgi:CubicO group peptidase (beta-lactamase class C family)